MEGTWDLMPTVGAPGAPQDLEIYFEQESCHLVIDCLSWRREQEVEQERGRPEGPVTWTKRDFLSKRRALERPFPTLSRSAG